ncbi:hypothetical protein [Legionella pneumophila]|uniref:hypothetical protein n=1 Tax=Legionella pneumophila TaxID=446 RepID=UPI00216286C5|nr:hypothetical protein [Legionella pneumophila]
MGNSHSKWYHCAFNELCGWLFETGILPDTFSFLISSIFLGGMAVFLWDLSFIAGFFLSSVPKPLRTHGACLPSLSRT